MPTDFLVFGKSILEAGSTAAFIGLLVVLAIPKLRNKIFGNGGEVEQKLNVLETNHLHTINETLERIERKMEKLEEINEGIIYIKAKINGYNRN